MPAGIAAAEIFTCEMCETDSGEFFFLLNAVSCLAVSRPPVVLVELAGMNAPQPPTSWELVCKLSTYLLLLRKKPDAQGLRMNRKLGVGLGMYLSV